MKETGAASNFASVDVLLEKPLVDAPLAIHFAVVVVAAIVPKEEMRPRIGAAMRGADTALFRASSQMKVSAAVLSYEAAFVEDVIAARSRVDVFAVTYNAAHASELDTAADRDAGV